MSAGSASYLAEISIRDFAIIDHLHIDWAPGFTVLTGETGAGKSIIIDALGIALGERAGADWIRTGAERASVELIIALPATYSVVQEVLAGVGAELDAGQLILTRDIQVGRSTSRVNGRAVPTLIVQQLAERLVDIHSQASHLSLLRVREHLNILDRHAGLLEQRAVVAQTVRRLQTIRHDIARLEEQGRQVEREAGLLRHEVAEIDAVSPLADEEEQHLVARSRLKNVLRLRQGAQGVHAALQGGDDVRGALDLLGEAADLLRDLRSLDPESPVAPEEMDDVVDRTTDIDRLLRRYADEIEDDPAALDVVEERLLSLAELKRKYGATLAEVVSYREQAAQRLDEIEHRDERLAALLRAAGEVERDVAQSATELSRRRAAGAMLLETAVERQLQDLGMGGTQFRVSLTRRVSPTGILLGDGEVGVSVESKVAFDESGIDQGEFLFSANAGEEPRPLARVASGGELARFMLALKSVLSEADETPILIFDELDQGVGGRLGHVIGEKLWQLSRGHHVLCITHLPQVAAYADAHYVVSKAVGAGRTTTVVSRLEPAERMRELADMLGGPNAGPSTLQSAQELLDGAHAWKGSRADNRAPDAEPSLLPRKVKRA